MRLTFLFFAATTGALSAVRSRTVFLAKPSVDAPALEAFFATHDINVASVDRHERFAFIECRTDADAERALKTAGPYLEVKRARGAPTDASAVAAAAWAELASKFADATAAAIAPLSHADRVANRLTECGYDVLPALSCGGGLRLLPVRAGDEFLRHVLSDPFAGPCLPLALDEMRPDVASAAEALDRRLRELPGRPRVRMRAASAALAAELVDALGASASYELRPADADVVACAAAVEGGRGVLVGLTKVLGLGDALGGAPRRKVASRAYWKLDEALARTGAAVEGLRALDLGAAPGGWTECLLDRGAREVVAVDPGALDASVASRPGVVHARKLAATALADGDLAGEPFGAFVCDMCLHEPGHAVDALLDVSEALRPGALVVVAVKLTNPGKSTKLNDELAAAFVDRLRDVLDDVAVYHLMASRARERTVVGRWRGVT